MDKAIVYKKFGGHVQLNNAPFATAFEKLLEQLTLTLKSIDCMPEKVEFKKHSRGLLTWTAYYPKDITKEDLTL
jgi:hypothetical protein